MSEELLPCPFCGGTNIGIVNPHGGHPVQFVAICTNSQNAAGCGASGNWELTRKDAAMKWNQRAAISVSDGGGSDTSGVPTLEKKEAVTRNMAVLQNTPIEFHDALKIVLRDRDALQDQYEKDIEFINEHFDGIPVSHLAEEGWKETVRCLREIGKKLTEIRTRRWSFGSSSEHDGQPESATGASSKDLSGEVSKNAESVETSSARQETKGTQGRIDLERSEEPVQKTSPSQLSSPLLNQERKP